MKEIPQNAQIWIPPKILEKLRHRCDYVNLSVVHDAISNKNNYYINGELVIIE